MGVSAKREGLEQVQGQYKKEPTTRWIVESHIFLFCACLLQLHTRLAYFSLFSTLFTFPFVFLTLSLSSFSSHIFTAMTGPQ